MHIITRHILESNQLLEDYKFTSDSANHNSIYYY
jgi:hypothetical protein